MINSEESTNPSIHSSIFYLITLFMVVCGRELERNLACSGCERQGAARPGQVQPVRLKQRQPQAYVHREFRVSSSPHLHVFGLSEQTKVGVLFMVVYFNESFSCEKM